MILVWLVKIFSICGVGSIFLPPRILNVFISQNNNFCNNCIDRQWIIKIILANVYDIILIV
jgi:hypothetical protein